MRGKSFLYKPSVPLLDAHPMLSSKRGHTTFTTQLQQLGIPFAFSYTAAINMASPIRTLLVCVAMVALILANSQLVSCATYPLNANNVNLRNCGDSDNFCSPSTNCANNCCCPVITSMKSGTQVDIVCKTRGQTVVNGDPYWLYVRVPSLNRYGWVADYYVSCGGVCPGSTC